MKTENILSPGRTSSKTRIETYALMHFCQPHKRLPDEHPAKQGLKHQRTRDINFNSELPDEHPAKQGLKLTRIIMDSKIQIALPDEHPAKQGLKLICNHF